jgi:hypothetical protein
MSSVVIRLTRSSIITTSGCRAEALWRWGPFHKWSSFATARTNDTAVPEPRVAFRIIDQVLDIQQHFPLLLPFILLRFQLLDSPIELSRLFRGDSSLKALARVWVDEKLAL